MHEEIIRRHRPKGYRVRHTRSKDKAADAARLALRRRGLPGTESLADIGEANFDRKVVYGPHVVDGFTLHVVLHEFAHVHLGHRHNDMRGPKHAEEWEAEQWAIGVMKMHGVAVPRIVYKSIRVYMRYCIAIDERRGHDIKPHIRRFARV